MDIDGDGGRQNSDFVGNAAEQKVIKGTAANSLSGDHAPGLKKDRGLSATWVTK
jgi:hypothetical protein